MDVAWTVFGFRMFASHPTVGSGLVIELAIFAMGWFILRRSIRDDRSERALRRSFMRRAFFGGLLRTPTALAGSSGDSTGRWPRVSFLGRAVLFTVVLEAVMSHLASDRYLDAVPALRTPYQYPHAFLINLFDVPIWIPVGWAVIFYLAMLTSDRLIAVDARSGYWRTWLRGGGARAYLDALFALSIDLALDPVAAAEGWWRWTPRIGAVEFFSVPISNFVAWFGIVFFLSLLVRTGRMFGLAAPDHWPVAARRLFGVMASIAPLVVSFLAVFGMVLSIYMLDARGGLLGVNSAFVIGAIVLIGVVLVVELTLPFSRSHEYDRPVVLSVVTLHAIFFGSMVWNIFAHQTTGPTTMQVVPISQAVAGTSERIERTTVVGTRVSGETVAVDVPGGLSLVVPRTYVVGVGLDPTQQVHVVITRERELLLTHDPELPLWIPVMAGISIFLASWPYMDDLSAQARIQKRRPFWILRLLLHEGRTSLSARP